MQHCSRRSFSTQQVFSLLQICLLNYSQGSPTIKRHPILFIIQVPFHCGWRHLQLFNNNIEPSKGLIGLLPAVSGRGGKNGQQRMCVGGDWWERFMIQV